MEMKKGIVFTTDVIVGIGLALAIILTILSVETEVFPQERIYEDLNYLADDLTNLLSTLRVESVKDTPTIKRLITKGVIKEMDLNKTVLDLIGSFWFANNYSIAENISREILENLTNACLNLSVGYSTIYSSCNTTAENIVTRTLMVSGYEIGKPVSGYIARAWATKVTKNSTHIVPFFPEGSGWVGKDLEIYKKFELPEDIQILNATFYVSIHFGTDTSQAKFLHLVVNGVEKKNDVVWLYLQESSYGDEVTTAAFGYVDVTEELTGGENEIYIAIGVPAAKYHSHLHPGMRIVIIYSKTQELMEGNKSIKKKYYFDHVIGRTGSWATISFFIPPEAKNRSAILHLNGKNVDDTEILGWDANDIIIYVNNETFFEDGVTDLCYSITDYYCDRDIVGVKNPDYYFNITDKLVNGTNLVAVYLNCFGDYHWGWQDSQIYSDPLVDPENSSYIEVSYVLDEPPFHYGEIDLTKDLLFGGEPENPKQFDFNLTETEEKVIDSFVYVAQGFSSMLEVKAWYDENPEELIFQSPSPRATPATVYIPPRVWDVGENHVKLRDFQAGGSTSITNYILPWSSLSYTYLVKALVGYGDVFNTSQLAIDDAIQRLLQQMGEDVSTQQIFIENKSVAGIRWLWGPSLFKITMWER